MEKGTRKKSPILVARQKHSLLRDISGATHAHLAQDVCWRFCYKKKTGLSFKSKMARDRASSAIPLTEDTLFVGPRIPDEIRRMIPHLTSIDKALFRKILHRKCPQK